MAQMRKNAAGRYSPLLIVSGVCINERSPSVLLLRTINKPAQVAQDKCTLWHTKEILMRHNRHPWFQACALFLRSPSLSLLYDHGEKCSIGKLWRVGVRSVAVGRRAIFKKQMNFREKSWYHGINAWEVFEIAEKHVKIKLSGDN